MTYVEQLQAALGIMLEYTHADLPKNARLIPDWYVACAAIQANQATAQQIYTIQAAYEQAIARMKQGV